ncbi:13241_t:CDS:2 [Acaulospora morrowiae]|uniref:13241_t:CDS:1 n=1 Tax=Acaulospora morrowiae TaxID=94023 RepID=A0A9N8V4P5_9GLOM|nr:13241_t:CDS:2 [Acaulospora morrowiae]
MAPARRSRTGAKYFNEFRTHFWERPEDDFDRIRQTLPPRDSINTNTNNPGVENPEQNIGHSGSIETSSLQPPPTPYEATDEARNNSSEMNQSQVVSNREVVVSGNISLSQNDSDVSMIYSVSNTNPTEIIRPSHFVSASCNDNTLASDISDGTSVQICGLMSNSDTLQEDTKSRVSNSSSTVSPICVELSHSSFPTKSSEDTWSEDAIASNEIDNFLNEERSE